jgi:DNA repair protein RecN (Recombination protein N)
MLLTLRIENLVLIDRAELELGPGLNAITGETGAGKTILTQAVALLTGAQPPVSLVGPHGDEAYVEAEFAVPEEVFDDPALAPARELRPEGETTVVMARRLTRGGRSRSLLWGRACARADLAAVAERLLEVSSQHEARRLARPAFALEALDGFAGDPEAAAAMAAAWDALRAARRALDDARARAVDAGRRRDELESLVERVDALAPEPGERERLAAERERLRHLDELRAAAGGAAEALSPDEGGGANDLLARALALVDAVAGIEPRLAALADDLRDASVRTGEAALDLRGYVENLEADPGRLEWVEARLDAFAALERRYAAPADEVVARAAAAREALADLESSGEQLAALAAEADAAERAAAGAAAALRRAREAAAGAFAAAVEGHLADLGMDDAAFSVRLSDAPLGARGADRAELLLAANRGLDPAPVGAIASGGELSRIALAIRVAALERGGEGVPPTVGALLLDEVDAGIGGRTARAVGDKLAALAGRVQILCITHLAQIAGRADAHFHVAKAAGDPSVTTIRRLGDDEAVDELARMLGGEPGDDAARRHAVALRG